MAQLIKKKTKNTKPHKTPIVLGIVAVVLAIAAAVSLFAAKSTGSFGFHTAGALCIFFAGATVLWLLRWLVRNAAIKQAGKEGENATGSLLAQLPASYTVIMNAVVTYDGKSSEIDNIVVGPTGVFIIETKNHNGTITANYNAHDWQQYKVGRGGTPYTKTFYSPVKQVGTHVYRLAHYLRENHINTRINAAVYFSHPEAKVNVTGTPNNTPVFTAAETQALFQYIMSGTAQLTPETVNRIVQLIP